MFGCASIFDSFQNLLLHSDYRQTYLTANGHNGILSKLSENGGPKENGISSMCFCFFIPD